MEGAIPAKGKAYGQAGGIGQGDARGRKQAADVVRDLGELSARFRDSNGLPQDLNGSLSGHSSLSRSAIKPKAEAPAMRLSEPARSIAAMLTDEHAAEDEEAAAGQRLAARFVRRPGDSRACGRPKGSMTPYFTAGAFVLLAAGAAAYYFMPSGTDQPAGSPYVAASFTSPFSAGSGSAQETPAWAPKPDAQGPGSPGWAETVETFRALSATGTPAAPDKVAEPQLEKLAAGYNGAR